MGSRRTRKRRGGEDVEDILGDSDEEEDDNNDDNNNKESYSLDRHTIAVPLSVALSPNARSVIVALDGIHAINVHPIPSLPPSLKLATSLSSPLTS